MTKFKNIKNKNTGKQTVFTHYFNILETTWDQAAYPPTYFDEVIYLGKINSYELFAAYKGSCQVSIYKGIKGDEFND